MAHRWQVFAVVSLGVFMASLDLFIVNIAFPDIARDFAGTEPRRLSWVLNAYAIVFAALLVPAGPHRRPHRAQARLPRRARRSSPSPRPLCGRGAVGRGARGGARPPGGRRRLHVPTSLGAAAPRVPARAARHRGRRSGRAVGGVAAAAGPPSAACSSRRAGAGSSSSTCRSGSSRSSRRRRTLHERREPPDRPRPDLVGAVLLAAAIGAARLGIVKGRDWGWGSPRVVGVVRRRRRCSSPRSCWRSARHPAPVIELADAARALVRGRERRDARCSSPPSRRCCSPASCSSPSVWGYSVLKAGLALAPGPLMAALFAVPAGRLATASASGRWRPGRAALRRRLRLVDLAGGPATPAYAADFLPGLLVGGAGVGLSHLRRWPAPPLPRCRPSASPPAPPCSACRARSARRSASRSRSRSSPARARRTRWDAFDAAWTFMLITTFAVAVTAVALGRVRVGVPVARAGAPAEARA